MLNLQKTFHLNVYLLLWIFILYGKRQDSEWLKDFFMPFMANYRIQSTLDDSHVRAPCFELLLVH